MATELKVPALGESINEVEIGDWLKKEGDAIRQDENLVVLESEKAPVHLPPPWGGRLKKILKKKGETAKVGEVIGEISAEAGADGQTAASPAPAPPPAAAQEKGS